MTTLFDTFVAIDWSGAMNPRRAIQVALCRRGADTVELVPPETGGRWTRTMLWEWLQALPQKRTALVGLDFAFAYPYCDAQAYFPNHPESPSRVLDLWDRVEGICASAPDFYGGPFFRDRGARFADYLLYQNYRGTHYQERFRFTEKVAKTRGTNPASVFKCVGPSVGVGSVAGMRLLNHLVRQPTVSIWPFSRSAVSGSTVVVEIFPQVFLQQGGVNYSSYPNHLKIRQVLAYYEVALLDDRGGDEFSEDERDALVSAAGLRRLSEAPSFWKPAELRCTAHEGWIFGIPQDDR